MKCNKIIELVNYLNRFEQLAGRTVKFEKNVYNNATGPKKGELRHSLV